MKKLEEEEEEGKGKWQDKFDWFFAVFRSGPNTRAQLLVHPIFLFVIPRVCRHRAGPGTRRPRVTVYHYLQSLLTRLALPCLASLSSPVVFLSFECVGTVQGQTRTLLRTRKQGLFFFLSHFPSLLSLSSFH